MKTNYVKGLEKRYLKRKGSVCPFCGSRDLDTSGRCFGIDSCFQNVSCSECGNEWADIYTLTGVTFENLPDVATFDKWINGVNLPQD